VTCRSIRTSASYASLSNYLKTSWTNRHSVALSCSSVKQTNYISGTGRLNKPPICSRWASTLLSEGRAVKFVNIAKWSYLTFSQKETSLTSILIFPCLILRISNASLFLKYHNVRSLYCINTEHLFWTDRVFSSVLSCDAHGHHFSICSGQTVCSARFCALMHTTITLVFVLDRPCVQFCALMHTTITSMCSVVAKHIHSTSLTDENSFYWRTLNTIPVNVSTLKTSTRTTLSTQIQNFFPFHAPSPPAPPRITPIDYKHQPSRYTVGHTDRGQ
jgi:hypothetical protein